MNNELTPAHIFYTNAEPLVWIIELDNLTYRVPERAGGWHDRVEYYGPTKHLKRLRGPKTVASIKRSLLKEVHVNVD